MGLLPSAPRSAQSEDTGGARQVVHLSQFDSGHREYANLQMLKLEASQAAAKVAEQEELLENNRAAMNDVAVPTATNPFQIPSFSGGEEAASSSMATPITVPPGPPSSTPPQLVASVRAMMRPERAAQNRWTKLRSAVSSLDGDDESESDTYMTTA